MVREQNRRRWRDQAREEGNAVLGIDDDVHALQFPQPQPAGEDSQPRARIHAELRSPAGVEHARPALPLGGVHVPGGAKDHLVALPRQVLTHSLEVALRATALRVGGIAPAQ